MEKRRNCSLGGISPFFHNIFYLLLDFHVKAGTRFSLRDKRLFEISEVEITRVNCNACEKEVSPASHVIFHALAVDMKQSARRQEMYITYTLSAENNNNNNNSNNTTSQ